MSTPIRDPSFILEHQDFVRGLAKRLVFDDQMAEDVAQSTWLAALEHPPEHQRSLRGWLATLVRNIALNALRGARARTDRELAVARREPLPPAEELALREALRRELVAAVLELEEPSRSAIILRYFDGLEPRAIAAREQVPVATVHTRLKRGLARLRDRFDATRGSRGAWALVLARDFNLAPSPTATLALAAKTYAAEGVLLMAGKKLIVSATLVALVALFAVWRFAVSPAQALESPTSAHAADVARVEHPLTAPLADELATRTTAPSVAVVAGAASSSPPKATADRGSLRVAVRWSDQTPAAELNVGLYVWSSRDPYHSNPTARTGADGVAVFENLPVGKVSVFFDRARPNDGDVQIQGGVEASKEIQLLPGFQVRGVVVDLDERAVADADIFMSLMGLGSAGFVVAHSGPDGRFSIRDIQPDGLTYVSARAPKRSPTLQHLVLGTVGQTLDLRLTFDAPGGEVTGRVLDVDAHPIAGAEVLVGPEKRFEQMRLPGGGEGAKPAPIRTVTDARGEFEIRGAELGSWPLVVRARGFAPQSRQIEIETGRTARSEIELLPACRLRGRVLDSSGAPVADADVTRGEWEFAGAWGRSDRDGAFELDDLPIGEFEIRASSNGHGEAKRRFVGATGATIEGDLVLDAGKILRGRVVDRAHPKARFLLEIHSSEVSYWNSIPADEGSEFNLTNVPDAPLHIDVKRDSVFPVARLDDVHADGRELVIEIDDELKPSVHIRGRLIDESGHPLAAQFNPFREGFNLAPIEYTDAQTGRFDIGPYPPGVWSLRFSAPGLPSVDIPAHNCAPNETWDLGDIVASHGASLVVHFSRDDGAALGSPSLWLESKDDKRQPSIALQGDTATSEPLADGRYRLHVVANEHTAALTFEFEMHAARAVERSLVLTSGVAAAFTLSAAKFAVGDDLAIISGDSGVASLRVRAGLATDPASVRLTPGHYGWTAWRDGKQVEQGSFELAASTSAPIALE